MYDFQNFGARVHEMRKAKKLTQDELAQMMGVSGQAVSKWENGQSYPDITTLPALAEIFNVSIDALFGKEMENAPPMDSHFPEHYEGLKLVMSKDTTACYSNKEFSSMDADTIHFADGSTADLNSRYSINKGSGEIKFLATEDMDMAGFYKFAMNMKDKFTNYFTNTNANENQPSELTFNEGATTSIDCTLNNFNVTIKHSPDENTHVYAKGSVKTLETLLVKNEQGVLKISQQQRGNGSGKENHLDVLVPYQQGEHANIVINGSAKVVSEILSYDDGILTINGSGTIFMNDFKALKATINGSGNVAVKNSEDALLQINGSGDLDINNATYCTVKINGSGDANVNTVKEMHVAINGSGDVAVGSIDHGGAFGSKIMGSGDITIGSGNITQFEVEIRGNGDVHAKNLITDNSRIVIHDSGSVTLGAVLDTSIEQVKKRGVIHILKRGRNN